METTDDLTSTCEEFFCPYSLLIFLAPGYAVCGKVMYSVMSVVLAGGPHVTYHMDVRGPPIPYHLDTWDPPWTC